MQVTDIELEEVLAKWEPKLHAVIRGFPTLGGYLYEDTIQELRMVIPKALRAFDPKGPASFHTLLHTCLMNRLKTLVVRNSKQPPVNYLDDIIGEPERVAFLSHTENDTFGSLVFNANLTGAEIMALDLLLCGYTHKDLRQLGISKYNVRRLVRGLRVKLKSLKDRRT